MFAGQIGSALTIPMWGVSQSFSGDVGPPQRLSFMWVCKAASTTIPNRLSKKQSLCKGGGNGWRIRSHCGLGRSIDTLVNL